MTSENGDVLLSTQDVAQPIEENYLSDAASFMSTAGIAPDSVVREALGYYWRSRRERSIETYDSSRSLSEHISEEFDSLTGEIQESDFLERLLQDYSAAINAVVVQQEQGEDTFGLRGRKSRRARLESIKEQAGIGAAFSTSEFAVGDKVSFYSKMHPAQGRASSSLKGEVIDIQQTEYGPAVVIRVRSERRRGSMVFKDQKYQRGAVVRLIGTVFWQNEYRKDPSTIAQGNSLEFLDKDGKTIVPGCARSRQADTSRINSGTHLQLLQVSINGTDLLPPHS